MAVNKHLYIILHQIYLFFLYWNFVLYNIGKRKTHVSEICIMEYIIFNNIYTEF